MKTEAENIWVTRQLRKEDKLPYDLLLLADETTEAINKYIFESNTYVVEREEKVIGVYVLYSLNQNEVEIKNIAVSKDFQGQGIGKFLLQDAEIKAKEQSYQTILIGTADTAVKQLSLYQQAGFEKFEIKKEFFTNHYPEPIFEEGKQLRDMVTLIKNI